MYREAFSPQLTFMIVQPRPPKKARSTPVAGQIGSIDGAANRCVSAGVVRGELIKRWPHVADRYEIIEGTFLHAIAGRAQWAQKDVVLLFTLVGTWTDEETQRVIECFPRFGSVLLSVQVFGIRRDVEGERQALFQRIMRTAKGARCCLGCPSILSDSTSRRAPAHALACHPVHANAPIPRRAGASELAALAL
jgi:hypothetical protein